VTPLFTPPLEQGGSWENMCEETISKAIITLSDGSKHFPGLSNEVQSMESILFISAVLKASGKRCYIYSHCR
jgi:hypothetical protein